MIYNVFGGTLNPTLLHSVASPATCNSLTDSLCDPSLFTEFPLPAQNIFVVISNIRYFAYALYKSTFYLLTYLLTGTLQET